MAPKTIVLRGKGIRKEAPVQAANTVTPGHLCERHTDGSVRPHGTAGGIAPAKLIAVENEIAGKGIDENYAAAEQCLLEALPAGCEIYAILATSQTIVIGDKLESNGDGTLRKHVPQTAVPPDVAVGQIVATALEAVTTTGATARIRAEMV